MSLELVVHTTLDNLIALSVLLGRHSIIGKLFLLEKLCRSRWGSVVSPVGDDTAADVLIAAWTELFTVWNEVFKDKSRFLHKNVNSTAFLAYFDSILFFCHWKVKWIGTLDPKKKLTEKHEVVMISQTEKIQYSLFSILLFILYQSCHLTHT